MEPIVLASLSSIKEGVAKCRGKLKPEKKGTCKKKLTPYPIVIVPGLVESQL